MKKNKVILVIFELFLLIAGENIFAKSLVINDLQDTAHINVSRNDVNRLVFPYKIKYQAISKEKDLTISVVDKEIFVKFTPYIKLKSKTVGGKIVKTGEKRIIYSKSRPAEIYVVTERKTYSIVLHPKKMESRTVYFTETINENKEKLFAHKDEDYIADLTKNVIKPILQEKLKIQGFKEKDVVDNYKKIYNKKINANLLFKQTKIYKGYRYDAYLYTIKNTNKIMLTISDAKEMLREITARINKKVIAYSIFYGNRVYKVLPNKTAKLVVVTEASYD